MEKKKKKTLVEFFLVNLFCHLKVAIPTFKFLYQGRLNQQILLGLIKITRFLVNTNLTWFDKNIFSLINNL
jgi:hypothetical protein